MGKWLRSCFCILAGCALSLSSCSSSYYYMTERVPLEPRDSLYRLVEDTSKYVIVHYPNIVVHLADITVNRETGVISGKTVPLPPEHESWRDKREGSGNAYKPKEFNPVNEVHITINEHHSRIDTLPSIRVSQIVSVHENKLDDARTRSAKQNRAAIPIAIVMGVVIITAFLVASPSTWW